MPFSQFYFAADYPDSGWSSWFGPAYLKTLPDGVPFGFEIIAPGSYGNFRPFSTGVLATLNPINDRTKVIYKMNFKAILSDLPGFITLTPTALNTWTCKIVYFLRVKPPPAVFQSEESITWEHKRDAFTVAGPLVPIIGIPGAVGPFVTLNPINRRRFRQLESIS